MFRLAIVAFLVINCLPFFSQPIYSREFESRKKNVPIAIINNHANYFNVLRYNKAAHDITIERRAKPSAEIIAFTPLKLDSLNASWFDYEKLDYLFFENNYNTCFLFERVLNSRKNIYLKIVDTLGKSSGFMELASLENEKGIAEINFECKITSNSNVLIIASQAYGNFVVKKSAILFDVEKRKTIWIKKLPIENDETGYSVAFACNNTNDLFYVLEKAHVVSFKRKYQNYSQVNVPVFFYDSLFLCSFLNYDSITIKKNLTISNLSSLNAINITPIDQDIVVSAQISRPDSSNSINIFFLDQRCSKDLKQYYYSKLTPLSNKIKQDLTFFDGTDYNAASEKEYKHFATFQQQDFFYQVSERKEDYYYKEILVWKNDLKTGETVCQKIIPRKIYSFQGRTRFKNISRAMVVLHDQKLTVLVLEAPPNFTKDPKNFNYHRFKKETNLWNSNLVMYSLNENGTLEKKLVYHNSNFDAVPMPYQSSNQTDLILYLSGNKSEKFAILKWSQL